MNFSKIPPIFTYICTFGFGFGIRPKARCFSSFGFGFGLKWKTCFQSFTGSNSNRLSIWFSVVFSDLPNSEGLTPLWPPLTRPLLVRIYNALLLAWPFHLPFLLKVSKSRKQIMASWILPTNDCWDKFVYWKLSQCSFFGRIQGTIFFFEIHWPLVSPADLA